MHVAGSVNRQTQTRTSPPSPGPFGYSFLLPNETPYDAGPAPPPGPSLLDDSESSMLDSFFTTLNAGQFDVGDSWFRDMSHDKDGNVLGLDWAEGLPPNLEGSTTSLSQAPTPSFTSAKTTNNLPDGLGPDSEILAAASMLYGNGGGNMNFQPQLLFPNGLMPGMAPPPLGQTHLKQGQTSRSLGATNNQDPRHMLLQPQHTSIFNPEAPAVPVDAHTSIEVQTLRWGSDAGFVDHGYRRPVNIHPEEEVTKSLLENMKCLEPQTSTTNTRAPTPVRAYENSRNRDWNSLNGTNTAHPTEGDGRGDRDSILPPRKRSKVKIQDDEDSDDDDAVPRLKKSKGSSGGRVRRGSGEINMKRPKSQQTSKSARENLSEEQKRTNHILSEQKRRNLIKQGFDELCLLVPELRGGGFSKSAMLLQAADYLEEVLKGNNMLKQQLSQLKSVGGFMIHR